jgi:hypothetical protein
MYKIIARIAVVFLLVLTFITTSTVFAEGTGTAVLYTPAEISSVLNNPYMGWAPWASGGPYQQPHRLAYANVSWRDLEPTKGNYAFSALETENKFTYWASQGVKVILRINMDYPGSASHMDIPDWLYEEINHDGTWYDIDWGKGFSPNYENTKLIAYHNALIKALGARYNNDDRIAMIALGSLGHWGEFHTKKSDGFTIPFPGEAVSNQYVQSYINNFSNKFLLMRRPFQIARDNNMGLFNDSFGNSAQTYNYFIDFINNGYNDYLTNENHPEMPDYWKVAPSGGEIASYPGTIYLEDSTIGASIQMLKDSHTSWLGPCSPASKPAGTSLQKNFDLMLTTMGYRFVIQSVSHQSNVIPGEKISISMDWANKGTAPFYYKWPLELSLADAAGNIVSKTTTTDDIRTWLPGTKQITASMNIPSNLAPGTYTLCAGIIDPGTGLPGIDLAISGRRSDGRYSLSQLIVAPESAKVASLEINGSTYVEVPVTGVVYSDYKAVIKDRNAAILPGETARWSISTPVTGVTIDSGNGKLVVDNTAKPGNITLTAISASNEAVGAARILTLYAKPVSVATSVDITGSTYIKIPVKGGITYSDYKASVKDQNAIVMSTEAVTWSLSSTITGVTLDSNTGKITVTSSAQPITATLTATSKTTKTVKATRSLIIIR